MGKLGHFEFLGKFDSTIEKAAKVASIKDIDGKSMYGQTAWLMILKIIHNFQENGRKIIGEKQEMKQRLANFI